MRPTSGGAVGYKIYRAPLTQSGPGQFQALVFGYPTFWMMKLFASEFQTTWFAPAHPWPEPEFQRFWMLMALPLTSRLSQSVPVE